MKTVIIGGGVSGLSMAYFLQQKKSDYILFEKQPIVGGNAHTRIFMLNNKERHVDMAVNDFNPKTYKILGSLLEATKSETGKVKVNTTFFGESDLKFKESDIQDAELIENITRFKHEAVEVLANNIYKDYAVKEYFEEKGYSKNFLTEYLYPRVQGLFFYPEEGIDHLSVYFVMNFYALQCGFSQNETPSSVRHNFKGGAGTWIKNLAAQIPAERIVRGEQPIISKTEEGFKIVYSKGEIFADKLVFACHADDVYQNYSHLLTEQQSQIISKVKYAKMVSVVHNDLHYLPVNKTDFSAYNCLVGDSNKANNYYTITYNCNEHQNLSEGGNNMACDEDIFFVTANPIRPIEDKYIIKDVNGIPLVKEFSRNICDFDLLQAQEQLRFQQGEGDIYFTGEYTNGIGLHENCLRQSLKISESIEVDTMFSKKDQAKVIAA